MSIDKINLYAGSHAIEFERFAVVFRSPLDDGDQGRFDDNAGDIRELFPAIEEPGVLQLAFGDSPPPKQPVLKQLREFARDGQERWSGQFGENAVAVTCHRYTGWEEIWPLTAARLYHLLKCVDPQKYVGSIEYSVADKLIERILPQSQFLGLTSRNIFRDDVWVPKMLLQHHDPRWDFQAGKFNNISDNSEQLERLSARSVIAGNAVVVQIENTFSHRFKEPVRLRELLDEDALSTHIVSVFDQFHDNNKATIKKVLVDQLIGKMGL